MDTPQKPQLPLRCCKPTAPHCPRPPAPRASGPHASTHRTGHAILRPPRALTSVGRRAGRGCPQGPLRAPPPRSTWAVPWAPAEAHFRRPGCERGSRAAPHVGTRETMTCQTSQSSSQAPVRGQKRVGEGGVRSLVHSSSQAARPRPTSMEARGQSSQKGRTGRPPLSTPRPDRQPRSLRCGCWPRASGPTPVCPQSPASLGPGRDARTPQKLGRKKEVRRKWSDYRKRVKLWI